MGGFGKVFNINIFGESHGDIVGVILTGVPSGIKINIKDFMFDINLRQGGKKGGTKRKEHDKPLIKTGVFKGVTTGAPMTILFENKNIKSTDYDFVKNIPRPGHADFVAMKKYNGFNDYRGGGHFSGRLTLPLVAAGTIAKKIIFPIQVNSKIVEIGGKSNYQEIINKTVKEKDSVGGIIECKSKNLPIGLGEPFFDSVESLISHLVFSIPAVKAIEFGSGFLSAKMKGSAHNDQIVDKSGRTKTNHSGGINGGITNGNPLYFKVAVKPTSSIEKEQETFNFDKNKITALTIKGRHDSCIALRVAPVIEAATAIVLADLLMIRKTNVLQEI